MYRIVKKLSEISADDNLSDTEKRGIQQAYKECYAESIHSSAKFCKKTPTSN